MHILYAYTQAQVQALQVTATLLPPDRITPIRIRFYQLRLAKSAIFSPRLSIFQQEVDLYLESQEEDLYRAKTNKFSQLGKKYGQFKDADWDSGYSDG